MGALDALPVALLVMGIGMELGGPTGYAINPARDLGPRIAHQLLPIARKGSSGGNSWVPVVGPVIGGCSAPAYITSCSYEAFVCPSVHWTDKHDPGAIHLIVAHRGFRASLLRIPCRPSKQRSNAVHRILSWTCKPVRSGCRWSFMMRPWSERVRLAIPEGLIISLNRNCDRCTSDTRPSSARNTL